MDYLSEIKRQGWEVLEKDTQKPPQALQEGVWYVIKMQKREVPPMGSCVALPFLGDRRQATGLFPLTHFRIKDKTVYGINEPCQLFLDERYFSELIGNIRVGVIAII